MKNGEAEYLKFDFLDDNVCFQMLVYGYWKKGPSSYWECQEKETVVLFSIGINVNFATKTASMTW